jgi:hypothetical protein
MINLNHPPLSPGKLDRTDFDYLPAEAPDDLAEPLWWRLRWWLVVAALELLGVATWLFG